MTFAREASGIFCTLFQSLRQWGRSPENTDPARRPPAFSTVPTDEEPETIR